MEGGEPPDDRKCLFCGRTFYDKSGARNHMNKKVCPESKGEVSVGGETCETCGKTFSNVNNLRKHIRTVHPTPTSVQSKRKLKDVLTVPVREMTDMMLQKILKGIPCYFVQHILSSKLGLGTNTG